MKDVQNEKDDRGIAIDLVGVRDVTLPIVIDDGLDIASRSPVEMTLLTDLDASRRGAHMSRFVEICHQFTLHPLTIENIPTFFSDVKEKTGSSQVFFQASFQYFKKKMTPVSKIVNFIGYKCVLEAFERDGKQSCVLEIDVPILSLCPCSLAISQSSAHNQRGFVRLRIPAKPNTWFDVIIDRVELQASSQLYSILKRSDEKYVVDAAVESPRFVEDIVRAITKGLLDDGYVSFFVSCTNYESIHNHQAYARVVRNNKELFFEQYT